MEVNDNKIIFIMLWRWLFHGPRFTFVLCGNDIFTHYIFVINIVYEVISSGSGDIECDFTGIKAWGASITFN